MTSNDETLVKDLWEARSSTPPRRASAYNDGGAEPPDEAMQERINIVESRLLEMVEKQLVEDDDGGEGTAEIIPIQGTQQPVVVLPIHQPHAYPCPDTYSKLPAPVPKWPQAPLMLRPTPGSNMIVRGIRYASSTTYQSFPGTCAGCILPVNTGRESPGKSLVVDFESPLFCGTLLMRVAGAPTVDKQTFDPTGNDADDSNRPSYFDGKKRKFQVVIKGRFRKPDIPMSECVTGQVFDRAAGKLPARFIVNAFIKFISTLAPQLEADLDGDSPRFLTPLVATAHTILARAHEAPQQSIPVDSSTTKHDAKHVNFSIYAGSETMEEEVEEPPSDDPSSVMSIVHGEQAAPQDSSITQRRNARKKAFNALSAAPTDPTCCFDTEKEYTFEFFQHLLLLTEPGDLNIDMGRFHVGLAQPLNGQPIKIMAACKTPDADGLLSSGVLWSFDLWHQALYPYAEKAENKK